MMKSRIIKDSLFYYYINRNFDLIGTEVPVSFYYNQEYGSSVSYVADFIAMDMVKDSIHEIEIKISKSDFIRDFKKDKHIHGIPFNKFYFCVPSEMREFAIEFLKAYPNYGLYVYTDSTIDRSIDLIKKAKSSSLNIDSKEMFHIKRNIHRRCCRELYSLICDRHSIKPWK